VYRHGDWRDELQVRLWQNELRPTHTRMCGVHTLADPDNARLLQEEEAKHKLEAILHPMIRTEVRARIQAAAAKGDAPYTVIVVPLLIETGAYRDLSQRILVVDCDEAQQVKRVMQRSGLTADAVRAIMAQQATREERLRHADDIVRNDGDIAALHAAVESLHQRYRALARATAA